MIEGLLDRLEDTRFRLGAGTVLKPVVDVHGRNPGHNERDEILGADFASVRGCLRARWRLVQRGHILLAL